MRGGGVQDTDSSEAGVPMVGPVVCETQRVLLIARHRERGYARSLSLTPDAAANARKRRRAAAEVERARRFEVLYVPLACERPRSALVSVSRSVSLQRCSAPRASLTIHISIW
jgi:hypothetical protein